MKYTQTEITDLVGRYLREEISGEQLISVEKELTSNKLFQEELSLQKNLQASFRKQAHKDLKATFQSLEEEKKQNSKTSDSKTSVFRLPFLMKIAASFLILAGAMFFFLNNNSSNPQQLFADAMAPFPNGYFEVERSNSEQETGSNMERGFLAYNEGEYAKANQYFSQIKADPQVDFYRAVSLLQSGKSESALSILKELYKSKSHPEYEAVRWYYGLCLLSLNKKEEAISIFEEIVESKQNYQKSKSINILKELK